MEPEATPDTDACYSAEQLSALSGTPRRTIRYYIERRLVPRPHGARRTAWYGPAHLERLLEIRKWRDGGVSLDRVNVNGGAIAMGHPLGATGAMILGTVLDELERRNLNTALVTLCIGIGMGTATIIERV